MTIPAYIHQALIPLDAPPRPLCGDSGPSAAHAADVTCPACLILAAGHKARTKAEVHDTHAIPANDKPDQTAQAEADADAALARLDDVYAPIKTHDLSVAKRDGNVIITVENELVDHLVYLPVGVGQDLGIVLDLLTPAQIALLIGELMGGEK